jgi:hypothetical protein
MKRAIWLTLSMVLLLAFWGVASRADVQPAKDRAADALLPSEGEPEMASLSPQTSAAPPVTLRAASGATITFNTQNGETANGVPPQTTDIPHLVLFRNGVLTGADERTLIVELRDMVVPPAGVTVTLELETQHGDPDLGGGSGHRIPVLRASQMIAGSPGITETGVSATFRHEFGTGLISGTEEINTPTDYYRFRVTVTDLFQPLAEARYAVETDHAFLLESQWIAPLPEVQEESNGAAPDELIVYYCDMFPFRKEKQDATTWLPRADVSDYVGGELLPAMVEAFRVQTDDWGFPWYDAWTSHRSGEDAHRLSVALVRGGTWYHGYAPSNGHSALSLRVDGGGYITGYDSLTDALLSVFHHELFHNLQKNVYQNSGDDHGVNGQGDAWRFFTEGTAVLAASVARSAVEFGSGAEARHYFENANRYLGVKGLERGELNRSYTMVSPYHQALYWRFLYEKCGGMEDGRENVAAGMDVIRSAFNALYSADAVGVNSTTDLIQSITSIMDGVLKDSQCPFKTHQKSLEAFARSVYALGLEGGRCEGPGTPDGCGFYDPQQLYSDPPVDAITYDGGATSFSGADQRAQAGIKSSFGMDFIEVILAPGVDGKSLAISFHGTPGAAAAFSVQVWRLGTGESGPRPITATPEKMEADSEGEYVYTVDSVDTGEFDRLALIVTRIDPHESADPAGGYTIDLESR